ncbi:hypothetical protein VSS37_16740 [Candidatus Thiothrix sp. Deng01]|uniref:Uncharacterized protein n=1 Tax=Candidatus Thiothrix phosphatis TaxID=3112415 RepID=A0ABU6D0N6_9GAMM|nr:hypothetical protein [Candidatus Thiothrix sp. Deng01]MEB4592633.1 hypothetical protein [Candidatus Thiothrix sp. Deng01]
MRRQVFLCGENRQEMVVYPEADLIRPFWHTDGNQVVSAVFTIVVVQQFTQTPRFDTDYWVVDRGEVGRLAQCIDCNRVLIQVVPPVFQGFMNGVVQECPDQFSGTKLGAVKNAFQFCNHLFFIYIHEDQHIPRILVLS